MRCSTLAAAAAVPVREARIDRFPIEHSGSRTPRPLWKDPKAYALFVLITVVCYLVQRLAAWWWSGA